MGTKLLKFSPIEVRGYRDPVAYFFGYDSAAGDGSGASSTFVIDADADDLYSVWLIQWSAVSDEDDLHKTYIWVQSSYVNMMPFGEGLPSMVVIDQKMWTMENNYYLCNTLVNPVFAGWKKPNTQYQINIGSNVISVEGSCTHYIRGYIYRELPDRI